MKTRNYYQNYGQKLLNQQSMNLESPLIEKYRLLRHLRF